MQTVTTIYTSEYRVKGSEFLGFLCPSADDEQTENHLNSFKKEHPAATHHCYAYVLNPNEPAEFSTDDGEPAGTAGLPILNTLKSNDLMNVILIVVRYYGGTKLGKSGLIDAYQATAGQAIEAAMLRELIPVKTYRLKHAYSQQPLINKWKSRFTWIELQSSYLETVELIIGCPKGESERFEASVKTQRHQLISFELTGESFHIRQ